MDECTHAYIEDLILKLLCPALHSFVDRFNWTMVNLE